MKLLYLSFCLTFLFACTPQANKPTKEVNPSTQKVVDYSAFIETTQNNCSAWQKIKITPKEMNFFNTSTSRRYPFDMLNQTNQEYITIYTKLVDRTFIQEHESLEKNQNKSIIKKLASKDSLRYHDFHQDVYLFVKNLLEKIQVNHLDDVWKDKHAQEVLKLDKKVREELWVLLTDMRQSQSFDTEKQRQLLIGDLANQLLLILYGIDYSYRDIPIPIEYLDSFNETDELLVSKYQPLKWETLSIEQKQKFMYSKVYYQFLQKVWDKYIVNIYTNKGDILGYWVQDTSWLYELLYNESIDFGVESNTPIVLHSYDGNMTRNLHAKIKFGLKELETISEQCQTE